MIVCVDDESLSATYFRDFKQWKESRGDELQMKEEERVVAEHEKMRTTVQAEIDLVRRKLKEETIKKRRQMECDAAKKHKVRGTWFVYLEHCFLVDSWTYAPLALDFIIPGFTREARS